MGIFGKEAPRLAGEQIAGHFRQLRDGGVSFFEIQRVK
jgi:hypothetical protein